MRGGPSPRKRLERLLESFGNRQVKGTFVDALAALLAEVLLEPECGEAARLWMQCIVSLTCGDAVDFFMRYPDAFAPDTACVEEFFDARAICPNFELLTE